MAYFAFFYFLLTLSTYFTAYFNSITIAPLVISYFSILYYFLEYMKTDNSFQFRPVILNSLLIGLFVFEFDNIIHFHSIIYHSLPILVSIAIYISLIAFLVCIVSFFRFIPVFTKYNLYICCISVLLINICHICFGAKPIIDVYVHLKEAVEYFIALKNPYKNIYTQVYSPEQIKVFYHDNPIFLKYVPFQSVPPVCIAINAIGYMLGDIRIINAILFCLSPIFLKNICSKIFPTFSDNDHKKMAIVALLFPAQLYLIFLAWTDIHLSFFMILFIYFFLNKQLVASYITLGILLSLKQYSVVYFIPFLFIMNLKDWRLYLVTGGIVIFPLTIYALWNLGGFIDSIILYELKQPFRPDSISIAALLVKYLGTKKLAGILSILVLLLSFIVTVYYSFKKIPALNTEYEKMKYILYVILFQFANFLMFSKQSFLNQYYFMIVIFYLTMLFSINPDCDSGRVIADNQ